jgi:hypothetical protein
MLIEDILFSSEIYLLSLQYIFSRTRYIYTLEEVQVQFLNDSKIVLFSSLPSTRDKFSWYRY